MLHRVSRWNTVSCLLVRRKLFWNETTLTGKIGDDIYPVLLRHWEISNMATNFDSVLNVNYD